MPPEQQPITQILQRIEAGDSGAPAELYQRVEAELRRLAGALMRRQGNGHTLQPTALVHEAWLKLSGGQEVSWRDQGHFVATAASAMRQILVDHARAQRAKKRGGDWQRVSIADMPLSECASELDLVDLDEALTELAEFSERQAQVVELRFLAGLEVQEVARALKLSERTIRNEWRTARAFLRSRLETEGRS